MEKSKLPRLAPENYRGRVFGHWTLTIEGRAEGWLDRDFHHSWRLVLLHTCARHQLACPAYTLMPDHAHLLCLGLDEHSDQRVAIEFLRKHLRPHLAPADWQRQPYDHLLRPDECRPDAFQTIAEYIFQNPVRAGLTDKWQTWEYVGCSVPGFPDLDVRREDYWEVFWRIYNRLVES